MFQECMLLELRKFEKFKDLELGPYFHTAGSMHIYERHFKMAMDILAERTAGIRNPVPAMLPISSLENIDKLVELEKTIREAPRAINLRWDAEGEGQLLSWIVDHKIKREQEKK